MITIRRYNLEYTEFEELRDDIYDDPDVHSGIISAGYSKKLKMAIFAFVSEKFVPSSWHTTQHHHPVEPHTHEK